MASQTGRTTPRVSRRGLTLAVMATGVAALAACGSDTVTPPQPQSQVGVPVDWTLTTADTTKLETGVEGISTHGGTYAAYLHGKTIDASGSIQQRIDAAPFRGQRVRATAWVTESFLTDAGAFAVGVDAPASRTQSVVSVPAPVGGSDNWHQVFVVFDVPANAVGLNVVGSISGSGQMFFDDIALTPVDTTVSVTTSTRVGGASDSLSLVALYAGAHATLLNADFEGGVTGH